MLHLPIDFLDKLVTLGGAKTAQTNEFPTELELMQARIVGVMPRVTTSEPEKNCLLFWGCYKVVAGFSLGRGWVNFLFNR